MGNNVSATLNYLSHQASTPENIFRLLVPATDLAQTDALFVELCGNRWVLTELENISDALPYTCISYSWGSGRTENVFKGGQLMSNRTIHAIETTIKASQPPENWVYALMSEPRDAQKEAKALSAALKASQAYWIDSLCTPHRDPAKTECLQSMGAIYNSAWQVFVVLSEPCASIFHQIRDTGRIDSTALFVLESDDWVTRAWAYQEAVNSKRLYFIAQDDESILVSGLDFLNAVTTATSDYRRDHEIDSFTWGELHPKLDSLEILIADYRISEYVARSAYQVMSAIYQRSVEKSEDHFYSMIGAVTTTPLDSPNDQPIHPSEYFMRVCEAKGDYSFIYCIAPRSDESGSRWRPIVGKIPPVLSGVLVAGCGDYVEVENGFFFPQSTFTRSNEIFVAISPDVHWTTGGAGLLLRSNCTDINLFCDVGVFIGRLPKVGKPINVG